MQVGLLFAYYNFVRVHSVIKTTPAEKAGVIEYYGCKTEKSRWNFLIREATRSLNFYFLLTITRIMGQCPKSPLSKPINIRIGAKCYN